MTGPFVPVRILNLIRAFVGIPHHRFNLFVKCSSAYEQLRFRLANAASRFAKEEGMETVSAVLVFLSAAFVGRLAARSRAAQYIDNHRWLRVGAFTLAFFLIAVILTGGQPRL
jgi:hypothetical protein